MTTYTTTAGQVLAWPSSLRPNSVTLYPQANTASFTSPFTRTTQTQALPGALWQLQASFPPLGEAKAAQARAVLAQLRGGTGRFYFSAIGHAHVPGAMASERTTWRVLDASTDQVTADRDDITADATAIAMQSVFTPTDEDCGETDLAGYLVLNGTRNQLQVGRSISWDDTTGWRHLHMIVAIRWRNRATGHVQLVLEPPMRERPTSSTPVHIHYPSAIFRLQGDDVGAPTQTPGPYTAITLNAVQAFPLSITL